MYLEYYYYYFLEQVIDLNNAKTIKNSIACDFKTINMVYP